MVQLKTLTDDLFEVEHNFQVEEWSEREGEQHLMKATLIHH
jgi:hypothetical protein